MIRKLKRGDLKRINILEGAVRSGKTWITNVAWPLWVATQPDTYPFLMSARTLKSLENNVLMPMLQLYGPDAFQFSLGSSSKRGTLFGRTMLFEGADNAASETKIRGLTLGGALTDETTTQNESFVKQILARMSPAGAKWFATTNPDAPMHWLKKDFIDRAEKLDALVVKFNFDDNPTLPLEYTSALKREYTGVFYRRFILGEWCAAEGAIYPMFDPDKHIADVLPRMVAHWVGVDYGHSNPTVFLLCGLGEDGRMYIIDEDVHAAADEGDHSPRWYSQAMVRFLRKHEQGMRLEAIIVDPSAKGFIVQLEEDGVARIEKARNDVLPGIQLVSSIMSADLFRIARRCSKTITELQSYVWDSKAQARGEDAPLKVADHGPDVIRYIAMHTKDYWERRVSNG